jgi:hypothetical protein
VTRRAVGRHRRRRGIGPANPTLATVGAGAVLVAVVGVSAYRSDIGLGGGPDSAGLGPTPGGTAAGTPSATRPAAQPSSASTGAGAGPTPGSAGGAAPATAVAAKQPVGQSSGGGHPAAPAPRATSSPTSQRPPQVTHTPSPGLPLPTLMPAPVPTPRVLVPIVPALAPTGLP